MRLRDLLAVSELQLDLVTGTDDQLDRVLRWVCTTDLIDPARYLSGGELVVTGMLWRQDRADSDDSDETAQANLLRRIPGKRETMCLQSDCAARQSAASDMMRRRTGPNKMAGQKARPFECRWCDLSLSTAGSC